MGLLEQELSFITLKNKYWGRSDKIEEEIDLRRQIKKKIDVIEELKGGVECEVKGAKTLQDLNYEKNDEIVEIARIELKSERLGAPKKSINFFKKAIIPKEHLRLVSQARKL